MSNFCFFLPTCLILWLDIEAIANTFNSTHKMAAKNIFLFTDKKSKKMVCFSNGRNCFELYRTVSQRMNVPNVSYSTFQRRIKKEPVEFLTFACLQCAFFQNKDMAFLQDIADAFIKPLFDLEETSLA
jgi:hypothetical protein